MCTFWFYNLIIEWALEEEYAYGIGAGAGVGVEVGECGFVY